MTRAIVSSAESSPVHPCPVLVERELGKKRAKWIWLSSSPLLLLFAPSFGKKQSEESKLWFGLEPSFSPQEPNHLFL